MILISGKMAEEYDEFRRMVKGLSKEYDPTQFLSFCNHLRQEILCNAEVAIEELVYLTMILLGQVRFLKNYPWSKYIEGSILLWEEVKPTLEVTKEGRRIIEFFQKVDHQHLQQALMLCWLHENDQLVECCSDIIPMGDLYLNEITALYDDEEDHFEGRGGTYEE